MTLISGGQQASISAWSSVSSGYTFGITGTIGGIGIY
jgi:hypothetical protein